MQSRQGPLRTPKLRSNTKLLMPWFLPRIDQTKLIGVLRPDHRERMFVYFKRYGCIRCTRKKVFYSGNGLCENCNQTIYRRLAVCDKQIAEENAKQAGSLPEHFLERMRSARTLLADLRETHRCEANKNVSPPEKIEFQPQIAKRKTATLSL